VCYQNPDVLVHAKAEEIFSGGAFVVIGRLQEW